MKRNAQVPYVSKEEMSWEKIECVKMEAGPLRAR